MLTLKGGILRFILNFFFVLVRIGCSVYFSKDNESYNKERNIRHETYLMKHFQTLTHYY